MEKKENIFSYNRRRASFALASSIVMAILVFTGLMMRLFDNSAMTGYVGMESYRMFTIDSNVLVGICALLAIPYQVDGIRTGNYHMPRWIVYTLFVGVSAVAMTFIISVFILAPVAGFVEILLTRSNLFFHVLNPLVSIILFIFVACDHKITFKFTWVAMLPVDIYAIVNIIMVFIVGEANGGWKDHYKFNAFIPWPLTLIIMLAVVFGITTGLRVLHNKMHAREKKIIRETYMNSPEFQEETIEGAVAALAKDDKTRDPKDNEVTVPRRILRIMLEKYNSSKTIEELCELYLHEYLH